MVTDLVDPINACPLCDQRLADKLSIDGDRCTCGTCGTVFVPGMKFADAMIEVLRAIAKRRPSPLVTVERGTPASQALIHVHAGAIEDESACVAEIHVHCWPGAEPPHLVICGVETSDLDLLGAWAEALYEAVMIAKIAGDLLSAMEGVR